MTQVLLNVGMRESTFLPVWPLDNMFFTPTNSTSSAVEPISLQNRTPGTFTSQIPPWMKIGTNYKIVR
jgi:hypothetical protein